ncbi:MAG: enoyl-CoA hydratase/isomerase family protein [Deltaproteobacteria bacterium]|nr:enoyl-CoA hydratase/isomerase family protein [Deltaproteobacteria bacterium]
MNKSLPPLETLLFQEIEPQIGLVTLNRPDCLNAINDRMLDDFGELLRCLDRDDAVRVLIITGADRGFCAGADLKEVATRAQTEAFADPESFLRLVQEKYSGLILQLRGIRQPVIAAVNGAAAGGGMAIALAADIRVCSPEAYFVASFINIGLSGGEMGSSFLLPRMVGISRAADILLTGRKVFGEEAGMIGLASRVVPAENLLEAALSYARLMTAKTVGGLKLTKRALEQNQTAPALEAAVNLENRNQALMVFSGEFRRLIGAFVK